MGVDPLGHLGDNLLDGSRVRENNFREKPVLPLDLLRNDRLSSYDRKDVTSAPSPREIKAVTAGSCWLRMAITKLDLGFVFSLVSMLMVLTASMSVVHNSRVPSTVSRPQSPFDLLWRLLWMITYWGRLLTAVPFLLPWVYRQANIEGREHLRPWLRCDVLLVLLAVWSRRCWIYAHRYEFSIRPDEVRRKDWDE